MTIKRAVGLAFATAALGATAFAGGAALAGPASAAVNSPAYLELVSGPYADQAACEADAPNHGIGAAGDHRCLNFEGAWDLYRTHPE